MAEALPLQVSLRRAAYEVLIIALEVLLAEMEMLEELVLAITTIMFREAHAPQAVVARVVAVVLVVLVPQRLLVQEFHLQSLVQL